MALAAELGLGQAGAAEVGDNRRPVALARGDP